MHDHTTEMTICCVHLADPQTGVHEMEDGTLVCQECYDRFPELGVEELRSICTGCAKGFRRLPSEAAQFGGVKL
jgi:hypothetical protein